MKHSILLLWLSLFFNATAQSDTVDWVTDDWAKFTQKPEDLYWTLFSAAFTEQDFKLEREVAPFKRSIRMVTESKADFSGGVLKSTLPTDRYIQAPFPVISKPLAVFYKKTTFQNIQPTVETLINYRGVSTHQIGVAAGLDTLHEVNKKQQAFEMVIRNRADYFIDFEEQINFEIENNTKSIDNFKLNEYKITYLDDAAWYMISPNTERGRKIMDAYIEGTYELFKKGNYKKIYEQRGFKAPKSALHFFQRKSQSAL